MIPKNALNNDEAKKELDEIKEIKKNVDRKKLIYVTNEYTYNFKNFQTIKTFGGDIYEDKTTIEEANEYETDLLAEIMHFRKIRNQGVKKKSKKKKLFLKTCIIFLRLEKKFLTLLKAKFFLTKSKGAGILTPDHYKLKVLTPKQMLQRLPIALVQVKAGNNSEKLLNEIRQIVYSLYQSKQITKKVYNNIIKSINV